jgi:tetratricopeptide (TPR) repeat protein
MALQADPERAALEWYERRRDEFLAAAEYAHREDDDSQLLLLAESFAPFFTRSPYWREGEYVLSWAVQAAERLGEQPRLAGLLRDLGAIHRQQTLLPRAAEEFARARTIYADLGDRAGEARALFDLGLTQLMLDATADAHESLTLTAALKETLEIDGEAHDEQETGTALETLAQLAEQGNPELAARFYSQALDARRGRGDAGDIAWLTGRLLDVYIAMHRFADADSLLLEALRASRERGDDRSAVRLQAARLELVAQWNEAVGMPQLTATEPEEVAEEAAEAPEVEAEDLDTETHGTEELGET